MRLCINMISHYIEKNTSKNIVLNNSKIKNNDLSIWFAFLQFNNYRIKYVKLLQYNIYLVYWKYIFRPKNFYFRINA